MFYCHICLSGVSDTRNESCSMPVQLLAPRSNLFIGREKHSGQPLCVIATNSVWGDLKRAYQIHTKVGNRDVASEDIPTELRDLVYGSYTRRIRVLTHVMRYVTCTLNFPPDERGPCHRTDFMGFFFKARYGTNEGEGVCVAASEEVVGRGASRVNFFFLL